MKIIDRYEVGAGDSVRLKLWRVAASRVVGYRIRATKTLMGKIFGAG